MIQSKHVSRNDLRSFNFGAFQTSLMTSCVPPFQCSSLPDACGDDRNNYSKEEPLSQPINESEETTLISDDQARSESVSPEENTNTEPSTISCDSSGEVTGENQKNRVHPLDFSSAVVITSGEATSSDDRLSSNVYDKPSNTKALLFQNNISSVVLDHSTKNTNSNLDLNIQWTDLVMPSSTESTNQNTNSFISDSNAEPPAQLSSPNSFSRSDMRSKDSHPYQQEPLSFLQNSRESKNQTSEASDFQQPNFSSDFFPSERIRSRRLHSALSLGIDKVSKKSKRSTKRSSSNEGSRTSSYSQPVETQKLFTPQDLSKELMQPNPPGSSSEIYQNFNAREAGFVLHRPRRKPRKVPLPPSLTVTIGLKSDSQTGQDGIIEPLATEDEVALREGTKEFMENGQLDGTEITFHSLYDFSPCEAVNFALENSIDNFDREEYVRFKRASDSDAEVTNMPESSVSLQSLTIKPENKKVQLDTSGNKTEIYSLVGNMDFINKQFRLENDTNSVPKSLISNTNIERENGNNISSSAKHDGTRQGTEKLPRLEHEVPTISNTANSSLKNDKIIASVDRVNQISKENLKKKIHSKALKPEFQSQSFESDPNKINHQFPKSCEPYQSFSALSILGESPMHREKSSHITKTKSLEYHKLRSESKSATSEKHKHKKSTKLYKNIKYYKITNGSETSFDNDSKASLNGDDNVNSDNFQSSERPKESCTGETVSNEQNNPFLAEGSQGTPSSTMDILEEVQSNLRARLASLEDSDAIVENIEGTVALSKGKSLVPYKPLVDLANSITPTSVTPPSSSSPSSMRDLFFSAVDDRKDNKKKTRRSKKRGKRDVEDPLNTTKALYKGPSSSWSSSSSSSSSSSDESSVSYSSPKSSSVTSSSSSSTSSSDSSSSTAIGSSDAEDLLI